MSKKKIQAVKKKIVELCYNILKFIGIFILKNYSEIQSVINFELGQTDLFLTNFIEKHKNIFYTEFLNILRSNSKKLRSAVTILFLKSLGLMPSEKQLKICALIELIHNATLIHDDILDSADLRRQRPSFYKLYGEKKAVLAGDFLLSLAIEALSEFENPKITTMFSTALVNICSGEINQLAEKNKLVSIDRYIEKSKQKTAELFKLALSASLVIENQNTHLETAKNFAELFGTAFQIRDDINDFTGKNAENKNVENDLKNGIFTAPAIYFAQNNNDEKITVQKIKNSDAIQKSEQLCTTFTDKALDLIKDFSHNQYKSALVDLCNLIKKG